MNILGYAFLLTFVNITCAQNSLNLDRTIFGFILNLIETNTENGVYSGIINYEVPCGETGSNRIVGGTEATPGQFPWIVSLQVFTRGKFRHNCGGSVVNSKWILTAAHCINKVPENVLRIVAGEFDLTKDEGNEQYRSVSKIVTCSFNSATFKNDIALLKLNAALTFNDNVKPICIPRGNEIFRGQSILAGWGLLQEKYKLPVTLQTTTLSVEDLKKCHRIYTMKQYGFLLHKCQMCTLDPGKDACQGDSGGPLMCTAEDNKIYACGLVSWGIGCARKGYPGVYTKVSCFTNWIVDTTQLNK